MLKKTYMSEGVLRRQMESDYALQYGGPGFYRTDNFTLLVTVEDNIGERANSDMPFSSGAQFHTYLFPLPYSRMFLSQGIDSIVDMRSDIPGLPVKHPNKIRCKRPTRGKGSILMSD